VLAELDVLYVAYGQEGILLDEMDAQSLEELREMYRIDPDLMGFAKQDLLLLHPLPRRSELETMLDEDIRAHYFEQARNGIPVRMGLLAYLRQQMDASANFVSPIQPSARRQQICPNPRCVTNHEREIQAVFEKHGTHWYCRFCESIS
jgi:aspartate carbamoyltransferase catalytic subunit